MRIFEYLSGCLAPRNALYEALELLPFDRNIISLIGGGGKTTVMYELCSEFSRTGVKCAATTTTHIAVPQEYPFCQSQDPAQVRKAEEQKPFCVFGVPDGQHKLSCPPEPVWEELFSSVPNLVIEADGARRLPMKAPADHEPVILPQTTMVIAVCGLDAIGKKLEETCHRPELAAEVLGVGLDHEVTPLDMAKLLCSEKGQKKSVPERAEFAVILNKADGAHEIQLAERVARHLMHRGVQKILVTSSWKGRKI